MMQTTGRIENQMTRGQLHLVYTEGVFNNQLAAVVLSRWIQEERGRKIRAHPMRSSGYLSNRIVDMIAKRLTALVTVE